MPTVLVGTWDDGLFVVSDGYRSHELRGQLVRSVTTDGAGGALAIVDGHTLRQRDTGGSWQTIAESEFSLSSVVKVLSDIYVGTDDAQVLRLDSNGDLQRLPAFAHVPGRETWYAGTAVVDGKVVGPPLGIRSITATCNGSALLANVHVGGIPRSTDGGATWHSTIAVAEDVHEVRAHDTRSDIVIAAAATGLCISRDGGLNWSIEHEGLHATHCLAVAFVGADILISASEDPFSTHGAVYRRPLDGSGPLLPLGGGLPRWLDGTVDTNCISTLGSVVALADKGGNVYSSEDAGGRWVRISQGLPAASSLLIT
ncbi:WD40/YVTN/BNR-like repeat-containing protein [Steroidobacter sp.]|uniref:WD40/YVTN/BNR-like repeat-containing protein n=1 Tax=Steroidobacter sp. TaxID=1978227 RepID=UPI001A561243|nr:hypothetical protein [Steroidobacter sp.]MBL8269062.1 hypothetical protein [Steroidobacter sp.]